MQNRQREIVAKNWSKC